MSRSIGSILASNIKPAIAMIEALAFMAVFFVMLLREAIYQPYK